MFYHERLVTFAALIMFLPNVSYVMVYKTIIMCKSPVIFAVILWKDLVTMVAWLWIFSRMYLQMTFKRYTLSKSSVTMAALIWFLYSMCKVMFFKSTFKAKALPHCLHWYSFSPLCHFRWLLRLPFCEKSLIHKTHLYFFSSVCQLVFY